MEQTSFISIFFRSKKTKYSGIFIISEDRKMELKLTEIRFSKMMDEKEFCIMTLFS